MITQTKKKETEPVQKTALLEGQGGFLFTQDDVTAILDYERRSQNKIAREINSREWQKTLDSAGLQEE